MQVPAQSVASGVHHKRPSITLLSSHHTPPRPPQQVAERGQHISRELDKATTACADLAEQLHASEAARAAATRRVRGAFLAGARWQAGRLAGALGKAEAAVAEGAASLEGFTHRMAGALLAGAGAAGAVKG